MRLKQVTEAAHRCLVRHRLAAEVDPDKTPHGQPLVQRPMSGFASALVAYLVDDLASRDHFAAEGIVRRVTVGIDPLSSSVPTKCEGGRY
jgi:hypothetical protein